MHTINFVSKQTGISQFTIRAWERRYSALSPERTSTNRRLYSDADIEKLILLNLGVQAGHSIGQIAGLSLPDLKNRLQMDSSSGNNSTNTARSEYLHSVSLNGFMQKSMCAIENLDSRELEQILNRASIMLGIAVMLDHMLQPLLESVGERWRVNEIKVSHEHMASSVIRTFLGKVLELFQPSEAASLVVITTPAGQMHEFGALAAAITAASEGWKVLYLGPNMPANEIAVAARQANARAVAISISYLPDNVDIASELTRLREYLGSDIAILAGGSGAAAYHLTLNAIGAHSITNLTLMRMELEMLAALSKSS